MSYNYMYQQQLEYGYLSGGAVALVELILWYASRRARSVKGQWGCLAVMFVLAMLYTLIRLRALALHIVI